MKTALDGSLQLFYLLIIHCDADGQCWVCFSKTAACADLWDHTCVLDLSMLIVWPETRWPELLVQSGLSQHNRLIWHVLSWLPFGLLLQWLRQCLVSVLISHLLLVLWLVLKLIRRLFKLVNFEKFLSLCIITWRIQKWLWTLIRFDSWLKTRLFGRRSCVWHVPKII